MSKTSLKTQSVANAGAGMPTKEERAVVWALHAITKVIDVLNDLTLEELDMLEDDYKELPEDHDPMAELYYQHGVVELIYYYRHRRMREKAEELAL